MSYERLQAKRIRKTPLMKWIRDCKSEFWFLGFGSCCQNQFVECVSVKEEMEKYIPAGKWKAGGGRARFIEPGRISSIGECDEVALSDWLWNGESGCWFFSFTVFRFYFLLLYKWNCSIFLLERLIIVWIRFHTISSKMYILKWDVLKSLILVIWYYIQLIIYLISM